MSFYHSVPSRFKNTKLPWPQTNFFLMFPFDNTHHFSLSIFGPVLFAIRPSSCVQTVTSTIGSMCIQPTVFGRSTWRGYFPDVRITSLEIKKKKHFGGRGLHHTCTRTHSLEEWFRFGCASFLFCLIMFLRNNGPDLVCGIANLRITSCNLRFNQ